MGKLASGMDNIVCVIGAPTDKVPQMIVAASRDSGRSANCIIALALETLGGKGGGGDQFASGRGADNTLLEMAVASAMEKALEG